MTSLKKADNSQLQNQLIKYKTVFILKSLNLYNKNDVVTLQTEKGEIVEIIIFKFLQVKNGFHYYSYTRKDSLNKKEYMKNKIKQRKSWISLNEQKKQEFLNQANEKITKIKEREGQPVHQNEKNRFYKTIKSIDSAFNNVTKQDEKIKNHSNKINSLEERIENVLMLDTPESVKIVNLKLNEAKEYYQFLKDNKEAREHSYSLNYARNKVKDLELKAKLVNFLWV